MFQIEKLQNPNNIFIGHNIKFDIKFIEQTFNIKHKCKLWDTSIIHALIDENSNDNSLKQLAAIYTPLGHYEDDIDVTNLANEPFDKVIKYNCLDSIVPLLLVEKLYPELQRQKLVNIFNFITEMVSIFVEVEQTGVYINTNKLFALLNEQHNKVKIIKNKYPKINLSSGPQIQKILYQVLGCPVISVTKKGQPSTDKDTLAALQAQTLDDRQEIFIRDLLEFRKAEKNIDHLDEIARHIFKNRVHTTYNLSKSYDESGTMRGAVTGRLSSSEPNLQNKPPEVREIFEVSPDYKYFVTADYSQIELRVAAFLSREPNLIKAFQEGKDVHTSVMCSIVNRDYDSIIDILKQETHNEYKKWKDYRLAVKRVNFGILYGIGAKHLVKLIRQMGVQLSVQECENIIAQWYKENQVLMQWVRNTEDSIILNGIYRTMFGRIRHLPGASRKSEMGHRVLRQGINFPIQSAASDICLLGIKNLYEFFKYISVGFESTRLLMTVHDEISFETKEEDINKITNITKLAMTKNVLEDMQNRFGINFDIPLEVSVTIGQNWNK